jgi:HK97 family phage major capsid protein
MSLYEQMRERRAARKAELDALVAAAESRDIKDFTEDESAQFDALVAELRKDDDRLEELRKVEAADEAAKESRKQLADPGVKTGNAAVTDPPVYVEDGSNGKSYFRDLGNAVMRQDMAAMERLRRNTAMQAETRALGNTGAAGGSGGEFAPPAWLVNDWINLIRAGRITADLFPKQSVPVGVSSVNYPRILTGTTTAIQSTQNSALSQTDLATGSVQTGFATIGGKQVVSQQLLDQTAINFDQVILNDLAADYGLRVGTQIYLGTGTGSGTGAVVNGLIRDDRLNPDVDSGVSDRGRFLRSGRCVLSKFLTPG